MKSGMLCAVAVGCALAACGADSTWTGAVDGCWTNAANWTAGVPGQYFDASGTRVGSTGETATFTACSGVATIDLDGVYAIGEVRVTGATAPVYTFGTSADQWLPLEAVMGGSKNIFRVDADVVNMPNVVAKLRQGVGVTSTDTSNGDTKVYVRNNAAAPLVIHDFGSPQLAATVGAKTPRWRGVFDGTGGGVQIDGVWQNGNVNVGQTYLTSGSASGVTFLRSFAFPGFFNSSAGGSSFTIPAGVTITMSNQSAWGDLGDLPLMIGGAGELCVHPKSYAQVYKTSVVDISCRLTQSPAPTGDQGVTFYGNCTARILNPANALAGKLWGYGNNATSALCFEFEKLGRVGEANTPLSGITHILSANYLTVRFVGATADTTDRVFGFGKHWFWNPAAWVLRLEQAGSADWTIASDLVPGSSSVPNDGFYRLVLQGGGAGQGIWTGVLADGAQGRLQVTKQGGGRWVYRAAMTYTGDTEIEAGTLVLDTAATLAASKVVLKGGTLDVAGTKTLADVALSAGVNGIVLADGAQLTVGGAFARTAGSLTVTAGAGAALTCPALAGQSPDWILMNGAPVEFNAVGRLTRRTFALTDEIAARGGVVPDGSAKVVGITTAGTSGPITLAQATTAVDTLVQRTDTPATVSLADGGTLAVGGTLAIDEGAAPLTVGATPGEGTLAVGSGTLKLSVADPATPLTVNAALDPVFAGTIRKEDLGEARFGAASANAFAGTVQLVGGTLAVTNDTAATLCGTLTGEPGTTYRVDGPGSYSSFQAQPNFKGDFVLNGGVLTMTGAVYKTINQFGSTAGALVFTNGAQLVLDGAAENYLTFAGKPVHFSGTGSDGRGALVSREFFNNLFQRVTLDDDTLFSCEKGIVNPGYITTSTGGGVPGLFDMQGHSLQVQGRGTGRTGYLVFNSATITNAGPLRIDNVTLAVYPSANLGGLDDPPITFGTNAQFNSYAAKAIGRPMVFEGTTAQQNYYSLLTAVAAGDTNSYSHAGPVTFAPPEGQTGLLRFDGTRSTNAVVRFRGAVSGPGGFNLLAGFVGDVAFEHPTNTFTGSVNWSDNPTWSNTGAGNVVRFLHPHSLANYAQAVCAWGHATAFMPNWSAEEIVQFANEAQLSQGATIAVDTSLAENQSAAIELSDAAITSASFGLGHEGPGMLAVTGAWTAAPVFAVYGGTLKLTGDGEKTLGATCVQQALRSDLVPELAIADAGTVVLATNGVNVGLGRVGASKQNRVARMSVRNATLTMPSDTSAFPSEYFRVGYGCESGILEIGDGAVVDAAAAVGCYYNGNTGAGAGAIWQTGGTYAPKSASVSGPQRYSIGNGTDCWGFYDLAGGTFDARGFTQTRLAYGSKATGVLRQSGGTAMFGNLYLGWAETGGNTSATYYMTGGSASCSILQLPYVNWNGGGSLTTFTLDGPCTFSVTGTSGAIPLAVGGAENDAVDRGTRTTVNLCAGGRLSAIGFSKTGAYNILPQATHAYVNFDGGTFATTKNGSTLFERGEHSPDAITLYAGGATLEVPANMTATVDTPLEAPRGNGIAEVAWAGTEAGARNYIGMPAIDIVGDGHGASAVALFDRATGRVTGVKVVSPGRDYTWAEAVIRPTAKGTHTLDRYLTNAVALTTSTPVSGGLRKTGAGTLVLNATNTYAGATTLSAGTLRLGNDDVIAGGELVLDGGTLDLDGKSAVFGGVSGTAGTVVNGAVAVAGEWTIDVAQVLAGVYPTLDGSLQLAAGTTVRLLNADLLQSSSRVS